MSSFSEIKNKRLKRRKQEKIFVSLIVVIAVVVAIVIINLTLRKNESKTDELVGLWIYDSITSYEFTSEDRGVMHVEEQDYEFFYVLRGTCLKIKFDSDLVQDCVYEMSIDGNILTIIGKEGTTGGTYELEKK